MIEYGDSVKVKWPSKTVDITRISRPHKRPLSLVTCKDVPIKSREEALALLNNMIHSDCLYGTNTGLKAIRTAIEQGII